MTETILENDNQQTHYSKGQNDPLKRFLQTVWNFLLKPLQPASQPVPKIGSWEGIHEADTTVKRMNEYQSYKQKRAKEESEIPEYDTFFRGEFIIKSCIEERRDDPNRSDAWKRLEKMMDEGTLPLKMCNSILAVVYDKKGWDGFEEKLEEWFREYDHLRATECWDEDNLQYNGFPIGSAGIISEPAKRSLASVEKSIAYVEKNMAERPGYTEKEFDAELNIIELIEERKDDPNRSEGWRHMEVMIADGTMTPTMCHELLHRIPPILRPEFGGTTPQEHFWDHFEKPLDEWLAEQHQAISTAASR